MRQRWFWTLISQFLHACAWLPGPAGEDRLEHILGDFPNSGSHQVRTDYYLKRGK